MPRLLLRQGPPSGRLTLDNTDRTTDVYPNPHADRLFRRTAEPGRHRDGEAVALRRRGPHPNEQPVRQGKIRKAEGEFSIENLGDVAVRSRETFKREIAKPLIDAGRDLAAVVDVTVVLMDAVFKPSKSAEKDRKDKLAAIAKGEASPLTLLERGEINILSRSEIDYLKAIVESCLSGRTHEEAVKAVEQGVKDKDFAANLKKVGTAASLDVAMFGRMITGDALSSVDAAVHVAHALTTHAQAVETDFFTAVDDLVTGDEDNGGGHLGEVELTSPMLYGYYVVDHRKLLENLQGVDNKEEVAAALIGNLIRLVAEYVVGAKKGSTAPYSSADLVMVEIGRGQPRTLAEAFRRPVKPTLEAAVTALGAYLRGKDRMYGNRAERLIAASVETDEAFGRAMTVGDLAGSVTAALKAA